MVIEQKVKQNKTLCGFFLKTEWKMVQSLYSKHEHRIIFQGDEMMCSHLYSSAHIRVQFYQKPTFKECYV